MSLDRRRFLATIGAGAAGAAGMVALPPNPEWGPISLHLERASRQNASLVRLDKNENPGGPFASARRAMTEAFAEGGRYPGAYHDKLTQELAALHKVRPEQIVLGAGSSEILRLCTEQFTSRTRGLVAATPTFEDPAFIATRLERPVVTVPVNKDLALDLDAMATAARGAGLVFLCNPNNPTSTVHSGAAVKAFIQRVRRASPQTYILVDEAYHEYVEDPSYASMVTEVRDPFVIVSRTFSKVYGMAGLRVGYSVSAPETAEKFGQWKLDSAISGVALAAASAALRDTAALQAEQRRNKEVRATVMRWFSGRGFTPAASNANFVFAHIKRDVKPVIAACLAKGVVVGRPFPPLETYLRLTVGTQAETDKALSVLGTVLT
jgi:histidinol-phosphate aminotransferase